MIEATVVICTRDRPQQLARVLDALDRQTVRAREIIVVDDSDAGDARVPERPGVRLMRGSTRGVSAGRNTGWRATTTPWIVCLDDDCVPDPDWLENLFAEIDRHPGIAMVWCRIDLGDAVAPRSKHSVPHSLSPVTRAGVVSGRWVRPIRMGMGIAAIDVDWVTRVGGWDERLGPGAPVFGGAEDIDFNWRVLRAGGRGLVTPAARVVHEQSHTDGALVALYEIRTAAWAGMCVKAVKLGDPLAGAWMYAFAVKDVLRFSLSPLRRRSRYRLALALAKWRGLVRGTWLAARRSW